MVHHLIFVYLQECDPGYYGHDCMAMCSEHWLEMTEPATILMILATWAEIQATRVIYAFKVIMTIIHLC